MAPNGAAHREPDLSAIRWSRLLHHLFHFAVAPETELDTIFRIAALITVVSVAFGTIVNCVCLFLRTLAYLSDGSATEVAVCLRIHKACSVLGLFAFHYSFPIRM